MNILIYIFWCLAGLCIGSFCNVLIFRLPLGQDFVRTPSHCMSCNHKLRGIELIPLFSFIFQKGRCRSCGTTLSIQYPAIEALNGLIWLACALLFPGNWLRIVLYSLLSSLLVVIAVIDWRTYEIPNGLNLSIFVLGLVQLVFDLSNWSDYVIGMVVVSGFFLLLWLVTRGAGIGMGDVKLMGAAGLLLGWQRILLAMIVGSLAGSIIHMIRMRRSGEGSKLAFGPYLSAGILLSALLGEQVIGLYLSLLF